jgi:RNA recognition motif-containing protein
VSNRLFVDNLPPGTTEEALRALFSRDGGTVVAVSIMNDRQSGESHGYAFVEMSSPADAAVARRALHGQTLRGARLHVSEARPRTDPSKVGL